MGYLVVTTQTEGTPLADAETTEHETSNEEEDDRTVGEAFRDWVWDTLRTWGPALLAVMLIRSAVAEPFRIPSGSMVPTLAVGDHILVTKFSYGIRIPLTRIPLGELRPPDRGDIAVFVFPGSDEGKLSQWLDLPAPPIGPLKNLATHDYVKRIVGLPGDSIEVRSNVLYINGEAQAKQPVGEHVFVDDSCRKHETEEFTESLGSVDHPILNASGYGMRMGDLPVTKVPEGHVFAMGDNRDHSSDSRVWGFVPLRNIKGKARFVWLSYDQCSGDIPVFGSFRGDRFGHKLK